MGNVLLLHQETGIDYIININDKIHKISVSIIGICLEWGRGLG